MLFFKHFAPKKTLLLELGNCLSKGSIWTGANCEVLKQVELENPFFRNGIIKNKSQFIAVIHQLVKDLEGMNWSNLLVGIDSSQLIYSSFEVKSGHPTEESLLIHLNNHNPGHKLLHLSIQENRVACLSIPTGLLDKIYGSLGQINLWANKFIPINYMYASQLLNYRTEPVSMIVDLGYRGTTISVFDGDFLISYKTLTFGIEHLVMALVEKNSISIDDARMVIKEIPLFGADERDWASYNGKYFRVDKLSEMLNFYLRQLVRKIVDREYTYVNDAVLTGWFRHIKGVERLFEKFIQSVTVVPNQERLPAFTLKYG